MKNTILNFISAFTALGYTFIYASSVPAYLILQSIVSIICFVTMFAVYRGTFYKLTDQQWQGISISGIITLLFFLILSCFVVWSMYFEFLAVVTLGLPAGALYSFVAIAISAIASLGSAVLMVTNGLELMGSEMPFSKLVMIIAFYGCVALTALHPFAQVFMINLPPVAVVYVLPISMACLLYFTQHDFVKSVLKEFFNVIHNPVLAFMLIISRFIDRLTRLLFSSFHFVAESFLPAAGVIRDNRIILGVTPKIQALGLIMVLTMAEVMQDYQAIFNVKTADYISEANLTQFMISLLLVFTAVACNFYSWHIVIPISVTLRYIAVWILTGSGFKQDFKFFNHCWQFLKSLLSVRTILTGAVCAIAGFAAASEMQLLLPLGNLLLGMFALSGVWVETNVYSEPIDIFIEKLSSSSLDSKEMSPKESSENLEINSAAFVKHLFVLP